MLSICALLIGSGIVGNTFATFNAETSNTGSAFAGGWLGAASAGTVTAGGADASLSWTPSTTGPITGQTLFGVDNGTNSNCTGASYASLTALASATTSSYTDSNRASGLNGHWYCYEMMSTSTSATNWKTPYAFAAVQLGLAATQVAVSNGITSGAVDTGDTITITFNQQTNLTSSAGVAVCTYTDGTILIGDSSGSSCTASSDSYSIGKLVASNGVLGSSVAFSTSASVVSLTAPWTVIIALAGSGGSAAVTGSPTWTFTPSTSVLSNQTTDQATACTAAATTCQPTIVTSF